LASATAAVALAEPLTEPLGFLGRAARPTAIFAITLVLTMVTLVAGELAPKRLAMQRAEGWALVAARPLTWLAKVMSPAVWLLSHATDLTVRLMGGDPDQDRQAVTEEEIRDLIALQPSYSEEQRRIITDALELTDRTLRQVLVPRSRVVGLPADTDVEAALARLVEAGHSRAPVYDTDLDDADRNVSLLSLVGQDGVVADHARTAIALPESLDVVTALRRMQAAHEQLALVVSEHGGVEGVVTVEDLVEELVGEIYDEHDRKGAQIVREPSGGVIVAGTYPLHDLDDLGVRVPPEDVTTVGGLVVKRLGRMPRRGDRVELEDATLEVLSIRKHGAERVRIRPAEGRHPDT
jgi:putative hemolysin